MYDYPQALREATLAAVKDKPAQEKADALNLIEAIIDGEMSSEELVQAIMDGTVPVIYAPNTRNQPDKPRYRIDSAGLRS